MVWIHGDEKAAVTIEGQNCALNLDLWGFVMLSIRKCNDQLRDDREHINLQAIELIEADPCPISCESFKELGHCRIIDLSLAIEHKAMSGHILAKLLDRLSLSCSCWADGRPSVLIVQSQKQRLEAPFCQR